MELGISQVQLAERMGNGIQQTDISRIERGRISWPRPDILQLLAVALELSTLELLKDCGWLSDEEFAHYQSQRSEHDAELLAVVGQVDHAKGTALAHLLPPSKFKVLTVCDGRTLLDIIRSQRPSLALVSDHVPGLHLEDLEALIWEDRLDLVTIVVGDRGANVPRQFHLVPAPASAEAIESILASVGLD